VGWKSHDVMDFMLSFFILKTDPENCGQTA